MNSHELMKKPANMPITILSWVAGYVFKMAYGIATFVSGLYITSFFVSIVVSVFVAPVYAEQSAVQLTQQPPASIQVNVATSIRSQQQLQLRYPQPVRVNQILEDTRHNIHRLRELSGANPIYWSGASFYLSQPFPEKKQVISRLQALAEQWQGEQRTTVLALIKLFESQVFQPRIFSTIDIDQIRITPSLNPLITENMLLILPSRPASVLILGAVSEPQQLSWQERTGAREYLTQLSLLDNAENSEVVVIQPDGTVEHHPIAYWNHDHRDIAPGATLYLGFQSLPSGFTTLNEDIINLLRHRAL
ncbi:capsule biosynthesis GfcC family protein [Photobacterium sp. TY1-4]|uniref:capsule biosynthesis GfcC family protein n=1 Tax=Photobacterium sp. TY1-4 TaxID=2899122 RepID=UPI0021C1C2D4|nr:capsule biosynthesis GfcC family protein [Photobacterium sp. TY1-4]UXI00534.1 capsule biosynthesis GfcC family protein [Photobacterium sp. TY1-4]